MLDTEIIVVSLIFLLLILFLLYIYLPISMARRRREKCFGVTFAFLVYLSTIRNYNFIDSG